MMAWPQWLDGVTIEMLAKAIDDCGAWIAFFCSLLGIVAAVIAAAILICLLLRVVWFLAVENVNDLIVRIERKALRQ